MVRRWARSTSRCWADVRESCCGVELGWPSAECRRGTRSEEGHLEVELAALSAVRRGERDPIYVIRLSTCGSREYMRVHTVKLSCLQRLCDVDLALAHYLV